MVAFYALLARERKTPYITNYIFPPAALIFVGIFLSLLVQTITAWRLGLLAVLSPDANSGMLSQPLANPEFGLLIAANACFYVGALWIGLNIWRLHNRQVNFRDDKRVRNLRLVRWVKHQYNRLHKGRSYEYDPKTIDPAVVRAALLGCGLSLAGCSPTADIQTIALCGLPLGSSDSITVQLAASLMQKDWYVQFTTCARHPYEWIKQLEKQLGDFATYAPRIVVVDGYTPHFGFTDSVHEMRTADMQKLGIVHLRSRESFAGIHTATAKAFNALKKKSQKSGNNIRRQTLLIFEGCRAIVDLESPEQYRVFVRHVMTSERMWGGMLTLFSEPTLDQYEIDLMAGYADIIKLKSEVAHVAG
jgi:hypothetical protein